MLLGQSGPAVDIWPQWPCWWHCRGQATHKYDTFGEYRAIFHVFDLPDLRRIWPLGGTPAWLGQAWEMWRRSVLFHVFETFADSVPSVAFLGSGHTRLNNLVTIGPFQNYVRANWATLLGSSVEGNGDYNAFNLPWNPHLRDFDNLIKLIIVAQILPRV